MHANEWKGDVYDAPPDGDSPFSSNQPMYRQDRNVRDDWGRLWLVTVEIKTGGMVGRAIPAGWSDPLGVPAAYMYLDRRNPFRLIIDYEGWAKALEAGRGEWEARYDDEGFERYGQKFKPGTRSDTYLQRLAGPPPLDPAIPRVAKAGDPKYLGAVPVNMQTDQAALIKRIEELERSKQELEQKLVVLGADLGEGDDPFGVTVALGGGDEGTDKAED